MGVDLISVRRLPRAVVGLGIGAAGVLLVGGVLEPFHDHLTRAVPALLLVLPVIAAAVFGDVVAAIAIAIMATAVFILGFIPPIGSLRIDLPEDVAALVVFVLVAVVAGTLVAREAERRREAERQRTEIEALYAQYRQAIETRTELEAEARRAEILDHLDRQRAALLRSVSHDLRTPLATIRAVSSDLQNDPGYDDATRADLLDLVSEEVERLDRLVANLLSLSRIEAGALTPSMTAIDLSELVEHTVRRLRRLLAAHVVRLELAADLPLVSGDYTQIDQVVSNLLENVARHTPPGTTVVVSACTNSSGDDVTLDVADDGPGLSAAVRPSLFEPFRSADRVTTGIGLAICSAVVEAHGGTISAGDSPMGGAWFRLTVPVAH